VATFYVSVSSVYSVNIDDVFMAEHAGNHDAIADEIADAFFGGECQLVNEDVINFEPADQSTGSISF
jgi:hypothetical protein